MLIKDCIPLEGNSQKLDGGAMFGNAPKEMWKNWIPPDELNRIPLSCRCLLIKINNKNYLFETGIGNFFEPKLQERYGVVEKDHILLNNLKKHNLSHENIDGVILSHLHFDHAGGLLTSYDEGESKLLFPNAKYYVGHEHWKRAQTPHSRDKASFLPVLNNLLKNSNRMELIEENKPHELSSFVQFQFSNGHTPGLMLSEIQCDDGILVFTSDLIPGRSWVHIPISMGYDRYPELIIDEKKKLLDRWIDKNAWLFFTHDHECAIAKLKKLENGKYYGEALIS